MKLDRYGVRVGLYFAGAIIAAVLFFLPIFYPGALAPLLRSMAPPVQQARDGYAVTLRPQFLDVRTSNAFTFDITKDGQPARDQQISISVNFVRSNDIHGVYSGITYYGVTNQRGTVTIKAPILAASKGYTNSNFYSVSLYDDTPGAKNVPLLEARYLGAERTRIRGDDPSWYYGPQFHWINNFYSVMFFVLSVAVFGGAWLVYKKTKALR